MIRTARAALALLLLPTLWGCFDYVPVERTGIAPESPLRVQFVEPTELDLSTGVAVREVVGIEGRLVQERGDTLVVRVAQIHRTGERVMRAPDNELFWLAGDRIGELEGKEVNGLRTALLAGGMSVGGGLIAGAVLGGDLGGGGGGNEGEGGLQSRIVGIRIPLSLFGGR